MCTLVSAAPLSAKKHTAKLPFSFPMAFHPSDPAEGAEQQADAQSEDEIEVDLGLQQALAQSMRPSPAKMHTKGNALHDISNGRLPTPAKGQGAVRCSPLQALIGAAGESRTFALKLPLVLHATLNASADCHSM